MKKEMDKIKKKLKINKKITIFLVTLIIIGIISGTIFAFIIKQEDKLLVTEQLNNFLKNINMLNKPQAFFNSLTDNYSHTIIMWFLGISVIGLPLILILFFSKSFIIGFTITNIIINYKVKGLLISLVYIFPHQIINLILYMLLTTYASAFSVKLIYTIIKTKQMDFKLILSKYIKILIICLIGFLLTSLYEAYIMPEILKLIK